jgi:hypothetical protein
VPAVRPPIRSHSIWSTAQTGADESCVSSSSGVIAYPIGTGSYVWCRKPGPSAAPGWLTFCASGSP